MLIDGPGMNSSVGEMSLGCLSDMEVSDPDKFAAREYRHGEGSKIRKVRYERMQYQLGYCLA